MGRTHDGRRVLRLQPELLPLPRHHPGHLRLPHRHPDPPGPRRGAPAVLERPEARRRGAQQHALRHHPRQRRAPGRRGARPGHRRGPRSVLPASLQGQPRPGEARPGDPRGRARARAAGDAHRHQQLGRRAAGLDRQRARGARGLRPARRAAVLRRLPLRRELLVHPGARAGLVGPQRPGHRARAVLLRRRLHHERQEGRAGQHRRLPGAQERGLGREDPQPAHPGRGLRDLRRPRRARSRGHRHRPHRGAGRGLPRLPRRDRWRTWASCWTGPACPS